MFFLQFSIIHRTSPPMRFFGIQVGLLQVALQNADPFMSHKLCQGEDVRAVSEHGEGKCSLEIMFILTPYQLGIGPGLALLASYLLQPAATPVTRHGKYGGVGQISPHRWRCHGHNTTIYSPWTLWTTHDSLLHREGQGFESLCAHRTAARRFLY